MTLLELEYMRVSNQIMVLKLHCRRLQNRIDYVTGKRIKKKKMREACKLMKERLQALSYIDMLTIEVEEIQNKIDGTDFYCEDVMEGFPASDGFGIRAHTARMRRNQK